MVVIGISGKIGTGKTCLARRIYQRLGPLSCALVSFGALLKADAAEEFGFPVELCYSRSGKAMIIEHHALPRRGMSVREVLQWYGTDYMRKQDPGHWVKGMRRCLDACGCLYNHPVNVVIDDLRFPDEAEMIKSMSGLLVRLDPWPGWEPGPDAGHESETALDDYAGFDLRPERRLDDLDMIADHVVQCVRERARAELLDP
ncbi:MAG: hypothetical protein WC117_01150 [Sphaerochaetaceae bacterium]